MPSIRSRYDSIGFLKLAYKPFDSVNEYVLLSLLDWLRAATDR
jgi:hypothetical protein